MSHSPYERPSSPNDQTVPLVTDPTYPTEQGSAVSGTAQTAKEQAAGVKDTAVEQGRAVAGTAKEQAGEVRDTAVEQGRQVVETAKEQVGQVTAEAKTQVTDLVSQGRAELSSQLGSGQQKLAELVHSVAEDLGSMASKSESSGPVVGLAQTGSRRVGEVAHWLQDVEPGEALDQLRGFARRRPAAFLLGSLVAGVVVGRLTRSLAAEAKDAHDEHTAPATTGYDSTTYAADPYTTGTMTTGTSDPYAGTTAAVVTESYSTESYSTDSYGTESSTADPYGTHR